MLVYCSCSLEPEEGEQQINRFIAANKHFKRSPISGDELGGAADWITPDGALQTWPCHLPMHDAVGSDTPRESTSDTPAESNSDATPGNKSDAMPGIDGFYAARLLRAD
jgi:16S rRNA C967 or C1407 C5-methylase (RsmB/RsmF family)